MKDLKKTAATLALVSALAAGSALADPSIPASTTPAVAPVSLATPIAKPPTVLAVIRPDATLDNRDSAVSRTLQPNTNPTALLFFTLMNSGGGGRYGR